MTTEELQDYSYRVADDAHRSRDKVDDVPGPSELEFQAYLLQGVSRTFALTIPQLPKPLAGVVSNAYLLCRIVDTIEDEPTLSAERKQEFCRQFVDVVAGTAAAETFAIELAPCLSQSTIPAEHELIRQTPRVIGITHGLNQRQRKALYCCVCSMAEGMVEFQLSNNSGGLRDLNHLDRYCYHVAGVVGEMLTELFCDYSADIAKHEDEMMRLAVSFGQGLQMTNILKDIWDDKNRGFCWLPQDVFADVDFDLKDLAPHYRREPFNGGLARLIAIAHGHLSNALTYTLLVPRQETGIRHFCLWAIGMAVLTLRKINKHRNFTASNQVKVSRRSVKATVMTSRLAVGNDRLLKSIFYLSSLGLPVVSQHDRRSRR